MNEALFFISGRGRSGTTLLGRHLDAHTGVCVAPECMFVLDLADRYGGRRFEGPDLDAFCTDVFRDHRIRNWAFDRASLPAYLHDHAAPGAAYTEVCRLVYAAHAHHSGKPAAQFVGDKNPHYSLFLPRLARLFSHARFIHLVRDPRANVASYLRVPFDYGDVATLAGRWRLYNEAIHAAAPALGARYRRLRFEDLVGEPERTLQDALGFLGATGTAAEQAGVVVLEHQKRMPWHSNLGTGMDSTILDDWRSQLSQVDVGTIERICAGLMADYGYPVERGGGRAAGRFALLRARRTVWQERLLFRLPFRLRSFIVSLYRRRMGTV